MKIDVTLAGCGNVIGDIYFYSNELRLMILSGLIRRVVHRPADVQLPVHQLRRYH